MINGFFHTIQQDCLDLYKACSNRTPATTDQTKRIALAAARVFGAVVMAVGVLVAVSAVPFALIAPVSTLFKVAIGATLYAYKSFMEWTHEAQMPTFKFDTK